MKPAIWTSLTAAGCAVAMLLAAPQARAQAVAGTEAGVALSEARAAGNGLNAAAYGYFRPSSPQLICTGLNVVRERKRTLWSLYQRAAENGQSELALRLRDMIDDLIDLIEDVEYDYDVCSPPLVATYIPAGPWGGGFYIGAFGKTIDSFLVTTQFLPGNDQAGMTFRDRRDPFGFGGLFGYKFTPWSNIVVSPFVELEYLNATVGHSFPNGSFIGSTGNWDATFGVKAGPQYGWVWLYGEAGLSVLNETLKANFATMQSFSSNQTVAGASVGTGVAFQPPILQGFGVPVSLFVEGKYTWWQGANVNTAASNFTFAREDANIQFGLTIGLSGARVR